MIWLFIIRTPKISKPMHRAACAWMSERSASNRAASLDGHPRDTLKLGLRRWRSRISTAMMAFIVDLAAIGRHGEEGAIGHKRLRKQRKKEWNWTKENGKMQRGASKEARKTKWKEKTNWRLLRGSHQRWGRRQLQDGPPSVDCDDGKRAVRIGGRNMMAEAK